MHKLSVILKSISFLHDNICAWWIVFLGYMICHYCTAATCYEIAAVQVFLPDRLSYRVCKEDTIY
jgi:hypothetical protein